MAYAVGDLIINLQQKLHLIRREAHASRGSDGGEPTNRIADALHIGANRRWEVSQSGRSARKSCRVEGETQTFPGLTLIGTRE